MRGKADRARPRLVSLHNRNAPAWTRWFSPVRRTCQDVRARDQWRLMCKVKISSPANAATRRACRDNRATVPLPQTSACTSAENKRDAQPGHLCGRTAHRLHEGETAFLHGRVCWGEARASPQHAALTAAERVHRGWANGQVPARRLRRIETGANAGGGRSPVEMF